MKSLLSCVVALFVLAFAAIPAGLAASARSQGQKAASPNAATAAASAASPAPLTTDQRAEAYYDVTMAHLYEQDYESSSNSQDASRAIDFFKQAYALDPASPVIGEQLAEMYFVAQRVRDAVNEVQAILKRDPMNLPARRLLARIYIRSLGDLSNASDQQNIVTLAIDQLTQITRLDPTDVESALWLARLDQVSGQKEQAEQVLRAILAQAPDDEGAQGQLAQLLLEEDKTVEAVDLLKQNIEHAPTAALYEQLGDAYSQTHDLGLAEDAYRHAVELEPEQTSHRRALAQSLFDQGKFKDAAAEYQVVVAADPEDTNSYLKLAEIYRQTRDFDQAEQQVLLAKKRAPGNLEVLYNEAAIYEAQQRYDDAIRVLSDAITGMKEQTDLTTDRRSTLTILYQLLGQLYRDTQNYTAAVSTFREMGALGSDESRRARLLIIETYRAGHDLPHALEETRLGLVEDPNDRGLQIGQAMLYGDNNQPDQASKILRSLLTNSRADLEIYLDLAQVYEQDQRFPEAEQAIHATDNLAERSSDKEEAAFLLGAIFAREKKYDQAEKAFQGVLDLDPQNAPALNYYGYLLADRGQRLDEAVALVQRALDEDPNNAAYLDSVGWAYYKQNKLDQAEAALRKAVAIDAHDPSLLGHLGDVLAKRDQTDLAVAEWEKSLAEWHLALPADFDADQVAELERKISSVKHPVAEQKPPAAPAGGPSPKPAETRAQ